MFLGLGWSPLLGNPVVWLTAAIELCHCHLSRALCLNKQPRARGASTNPEPKALLFSHDQMQSAVVEP
jgi:hypothetical protein